jgi:dihydrofolate reductase
MSKVPGKPISIIVAVARNWAIGMNNQLLWHIPEDFKWFKKHTSGHPVIMGRRTWESLPLKPLPGRKNIVITDDPTDCFPGTTCVGSIDAAVAHMDDTGENFIIGGGRYIANFCHWHRKFISPLWTKILMLMSGFRNWIPVNGKNLTVKSIPNMIRDILF